MKNVGVKSLRYYERLGILPPAFVDPQSGYRYYSMNQMVDIDVITTCISLGIPLKELTDYLHPHSVLDIEPLLERGRGIAVQRLRAQGAILIGKTTTSEFGAKCLTDAPLFGRTPNAWSPRHTSGGSSGGPIR